MQEEIWKDIPGYEGLYQVSNLGKVRSLDRIVAVQNGFTRVSKGKEIKPNKSRSYYTVCLSRKNKKMCILLHRIVAYVFIPNPEGKRTVNHINGDKGDNRVENLEWNTHSENITHAFRVLKRTANKYWLGKRESEFHHTKRVRQLSLDGILIAEYGSITEAARKTNSHITCISQVLNGTHKTAGGFKWEYIRENAI